MWRTRDLARWLALPAAERARIVRAGLWLLACDAALRTIGFARLERWLARRRPETTHSSIDDWVRAVDVAARRHLYPMRCLPRALVLRHLLRGEGVEVELRFGVRREGVGIAAHAWLERDGAAIGEPLGFDGRFAPLESRPPR